MTTLGVLGDLHGLHLRSMDAAFAAMDTERVDGILLVGDFASASWERTCRGTPDQLETLTEGLRRLFARLGRVAGSVAWVPGNHDLPHLDLPGATDGRLTEIAGIRIWGIGGAGPARFGFPYEWSEAQVAAIEVPACDLLLSHTPPRGTLDRTIAGIHVGSTAIRDHALDVEVTVCGHIHEAAGVARLGSTLCLNAGSLGEPFSRPQVGFVRFGDDEIEIEHRTLDDDRRRSLRRPRRSVAV